MPHDPNKVKLVDTYAKRVHFKGRGKTTKPTCPHCQQDLKRSYESVEIASGNWSKVPYGWHCKPCKYQIFD